MSDGKINSKRFLILSDGKMGHQNQSVRLVEKLGVTDYEILTLKRRKFGKLFSFISPIYIVKNLQDLKSLFKSNDFDVIVGLGSVPRLAMLYIKKKYPQVKTICIMDPKRNYEDYDVIAAPTHDNIKYNGNNVVRFTGSLSYFSEEDLQIARDEFKEEFSKFNSSNLIGLVIGGNSKGYDFTMSKAKNLLEKTLMLSNKVNSNIYATTSRRTSSAQTDYIKYKMESTGNDIYVSGDRNPYRAIMGYSSIIIVTPETVSMLMESCATNALVLIFDRKSVKSKRIKSFTQELINKGVLFDLEDILCKDNIDDYINKAKNKDKFNELDKVVDFIKLRKVV